MTKSTSKLPTPMLNPTMLRTAIRRSRALRSLPPTSSPRAATPPPRRREHQPHAGYGQHLVLDVAHDFVHAGQARPLRGAHGHVELPLVRVGREGVLGEPQGAGGRAP